MSPLLEDRIKLLENSVLELQKSSKNLKKDKVKRSPTAYALFIKNNMSSVREDNPGKTQKEIFSLCAKKYQDSKI
jgi:hypothetical protein